jgi:acyl carrier protein
MQESTFAVVRDILVTDLGVEEEKVTRGAHLLEDLELDSTDTVEISLQLKKRLGADVKLQVRDDPTIEEVCAMVDTALADQKEGSATHT